MQPYEHFTREIAAGLRGKTTAAFFDFDGTIIATHSVRDMFLERLKNGEITSQELFDLGDMVTRYLLNVSGFEEALVRNVLTMVGRAEFKRRQAPPGVKITPKAFGRDRRVPITNRFWYERPRPSK